MKKEHNKQRASARPDAADNGAAAPNNGVAINWRLLDQRLEEARQASIAMGCYAPRGIKPRTPEQRAALAESTRRLNAMTLPKARRKSEDLIREMRDASVGVYPEPKS